MCGRLYLKNQQGHEENYRKSHRSTDPCQGGRANFATQKSPQDDSLGMLGEGSGFSRSRQEEVSSQALGP
eukprot:1844890-Amphidinium_carterae.1